MLICRTKNASLLYYEPLDSRLVLKYSILPYFPVSPAPCVNNIEGLPPDDYTEKKVIGFPVPCRDDVTNQTLPGGPQRHNTENSKQIFPEKELRGLSPNAYIHVSVSDLYIPAISLPILLQENSLT
jgi:hypothetical protein